MKKQSHIALGAVIVLPLLLTKSIDLVTGIVGILASIAPDWDIRLHIPHRTITHSLLALAVSTGVVFLLDPLSAMLWGYCYSLHLITDSFTKMGVPFLYPFCKNYYGFRWFREGTFTDTIIMFIVLGVLYFVVGLLPF